MSWGSSGGEASATLNQDYLAADGIENVIRVLEDLEDEKFTELEFIELNACAGGCVGGVPRWRTLCRQSPAQAAAQSSPIACNHIGDSVPEDYGFDLPIEYSPILKLDPNFIVAFQKMSEMQRIAKSLPGLDCGSCGAPSCKALAEDVVRGHAKVDDCIFRLREHMHTLVDEISRLEGYIPPPNR
ncbi:MAG: (Fe-S)-binding protein [Oscillospiraceae bacterium]